MWIRLEWQLSDGLQLKVTHLFHRRAKVAPMKPGNFCNMLSVFIRMYSECVRVVCSTGGCCRRVRWWLLCFSSMSHSIHLSFLDCLCHDEYFSSPGLMLTNILQLFMCISVKKFIESLCKQRQEFYIYIYESQQNSYSDINYLSDRDKSCVGVVLSLCAPQHLSAHKG